MDDETTNKDQDELQKSGRTSANKDKGGSTKDKVTISKAEHDKLVEDAKASAGRARKLSEVEAENARLKDRLETTNSRLDELERHFDETRLAEARGDPDKLRNYQAEQTLSKRERDARDKEQEIARREEQLKADREQFDKDRGTVSLAYAAAKHGLQVEDLEDLGISDPDILDKVAEKIASGKGTETGKEVEGEGGTGEEEEWKPDSGEGVGGGKGKLTTENVDGMSMEALEKELKEETSS